MDNWIKSCAIKGKIQDEFPFNLPLFHEDIELNFTKPITIICGENGSGKSTVLESLAVNVGFSIYGGSSNNLLTQVQVPKLVMEGGRSFYEGTIEKQLVNPDNTRLTESMKLCWSTKTRKGFFLRAEHLNDSIVNTGARNEIHCRSHGEGLMGFIKIYCKGDGIYIFDEPETALSPSKQMQLLAYINEHTKTKRAQYIIATHSPILMAIPNSELYYIEENRFVQKDYKDTLHFQLYKRFTLQPELFVERLIEDLT